MPLIMTLDLDGIPDNLQNAEDVPYDDCDNISIEKPEDSFLVVD